MALRLSEQRLRLVPPPETAGTPEPASRSKDGDGEPGTPPPGEKPGGEPGDFYADAMETV
jgi:hypothetical protein